MSRDYKKEYEEYHSLPEQKKNRAKRNKANRNSNTKPGQEVDHKVPLSQGGSNSPNNWRVVSKETNRKKGSKKMSSFDELRLAIAEKTASTAGYDDGASTSNYVNMSDPRSQKGSGEQGMYRQVPILDSPLENNSFLGFDQGPQPYVLSANAAKLREELAQIEGLDVAPEDYTENWDEGPLVEYGHLGYDLGEEKEKLILEALKRGRISSKETNRKKGSKKMSSFYNLKASIPIKTAASAAVTPAEKAEIDKIRAQIAIIKSSQGGEGESLSNAAADAYAKALTRLGYGVDMIDLKDVPYVDDWDDEYREAQKARLAKSQATVLATPVYNWGPSARLNAFIQNAVKAGQDPYRPYSIVAAAGSPRSQGYLHSLQNTLAMEDKGINVGAPLMATEDDVKWDGETPTGLQRAYLNRIRENARVLGDLAQDRLDARTQKTASPDGVERLPSGGIKYRGETFPGYNKPKQAPAGSKHKKRVLAKKGDKVKVVNFGARGYKHNYSPEAKKNYLARSAGIKGKDDKFSANYWSRRELWPKNQKADGSSKKKTAAAVELLGAGAGAIGQYEARKKLEDAGFDGKEISEVSSMGGGALRGFGKSLGYGLGGGILGAALGSALDMYQQDDDSSSEYPNLPIYHNKMPYNAVIGTLAGSLLGKAYGAYRGYAGELERAEEALERSKRLENRIAEKVFANTKTSAEEKFNPSAYAASLSPEDRQRIQKAIFASTSGISSEIKKELAPINKEIEEAYAPYRERIKAVTDRYRDRMYEAMLSGFQEGGASEDYLNYIRDNKDTFSLKSGVKISSADDNFDTSELEAFIRSVKK